MIVNPAKTAEPAKMLFGLWTLVCPRKRTRWWSRFPHVKGQF